MARDEGTLVDIARAAHSVLAFTQGMRKEQFLEDFKSPHLISVVGQTDLLSQLSPEAHICAS